MDWTVSVSCIYALLIKREVRWMDIGQNVFVDQNEVEVYKNPKPGLVKISCIVTFSFGTNAENETEKLSNVQNKKQSGKWGWVPDMISVICAYKTFGPEDSSSAQRSKKRERRLPLARQSDPI